MAAMVVGLADAVQCEPMPADGVHPPETIPAPDRPSGRADMPPRLQASWVFAYGSLIWSPDFPYVERHRVRIHGYHRAFCIDSIHYRGTPAAPGVVLGLDRGGSCQGVVFRLPAIEEPRIIEALYEREMMNHVYTPRCLSVRLPDARLVSALAFVARRDHPAYLRLPRSEILRRLSTCRGGRGPNRDYAINTWQALREWGIADPGLAAIVRDLTLDAVSSPRSSAET